MRLKVFMGIAATERLAVIAVVLLLPYFSPVSASYPTPPERNYDVGITTFSLDYLDPKGNTQTVDAAVWYPTGDKVSVYNYSSGSKSYLAVDGKLTDGQLFPLIIFNHGFNATEMQSLYLKEALASEGYIVASVRFNDNIWSGMVEFLNFNNHSTGDGVNGYLRDVYEQYFETYRLPAAEALLDYMLKEGSQPGSLFYSGIDNDAIGMGGHSFGGLTTLGLIGGHHDPEIEDPRIKAALLLSSPSFPFETHISNIDIPIMAMRGDYDLLLNRPEDAFWYLGGEVNPPYYYLVLRGADHFVFSESCADIGWVSEGMSGDERLRTINLYSLAFFDLYLKNDTSAATLLSQVSPELLSYDWLATP